MIGRQISHYKILEKRSEGGMGVVYKAQDTKLDRVVALKFLSKRLLNDEEARKRFTQEAKSVSALDHQNIATIYEIDEVEGEFFISMAYIEGKTLKELIKEKPLSLKEVLRISIQIGEGLNAAHQKGIIHKDIKSDNIMITKEGVAKITDFGLAELRSADTLADDGTVSGTLQYMSPEQAQGLPLDLRSDIFSFGVVIYEMITGQMPFKGEHSAALTYSILFETPEPLATYKVEVSEEFQKIIDKALQKEVEARYQQTEELVADLKSLQKNPSLWHKDVGKYTVSAYLSEVLTRIKAPPKMGKPWVSNKDFTERMIRMLKRYKKTELRVICYSFISSKTIEREIEKFLKEGGTLRVLMVRPKSLGFNEKATLEGFAGVNDKQKLEDWKNSVEETRNSHAKEIQSNIARLHKWQRQYGGSVDFKLYSDTPNFRAFMFGNKAMYVSSYFISPCDSGQNNLHLICEGLDETKVDPNFLMLQCILSNWFEVKFVTGSKA
jgi:serine/threonine protein kinase